MTPSTKPAGQFMLLLSPQGSFRIDQVWASAMPAGGATGRLLTTA